MMTKVAMKFIAMIAMLAATAECGNTNFTHKTACPASPYIHNPATGDQAPWSVTQYCNQTSFFGGKAPLTLGTGYAIVLGFGVFFSLFTTFLVWLDAKFVGTKYSSENFNTAGRSVKTGLTASVIVSQWTWAATLLQSSNVAHQYGVSGPFWYASGASIQILLFGILSIELKRKAPKAHTMCELIDQRWGATAHKVFLFFAFLTNIIVTAMLLLGGAAVVEALTGMDRNLASFLIPIGTILYTMSGGLKATFLASYIHTAIIFIILVCFVVAVYMTSPDLGSPSKVYANLQTLSSVFPVANNEGGSYVTMLSGGGLMFGIVNIVGNFGTVFCDQAYWQSAIAAEPSAASNGYLLGGLVWFTIPFALATALGLSSLALDLPITTAEAGSGLVPPAAAVHMWGPGGAVAIAVMLFMAITSTGSAEMIAVSSLVAYDIYRRYSNPEATGEQILKVSRIFIVVFGLFMGVLSVGLNAMGLSLGWVYMAMGVMIGSAVIPVSFVLLWNKASGNGAIAGAIIGVILGVTSWLITAQSYGGEISLKSTGMNEPLLIGNLVSILSSGVICVIVSLCKPDNYDWENGAMKTGIILVEKDAMPNIKETPQELGRAKSKILKWGLGFTLLIILAWPLASLPAGVFTEGYFTFWVVVAIIWSLVATIAIIALPIWEARTSIYAIIGGMVSCDPAASRSALDIAEKAAKKAAVVEIGSRSV